MTYATTYGTLLREAAEPLPNVAGVTLGPLLERLEQARVVLLGAATMGTSECYRLRARITHELIVRGGFTTVALACGEPEAWWLDRYVRAGKAPSLWPPPLSGFPNWAWRNGETFGFARWLQSHNNEIRADDQVGIYGLDLFDFYDTAGSIIEHLDARAPEAARLARARFACLAPWVGDPAAYTDMVLPPEAQRQERHVTDLLRKRLGQRLKAISRQRAPRTLRGSAGALVDSDRFFHLMYNGSLTACCARAQKMFDGVRLLLAAEDRDVKLVVWAHNADVGDASATSLGPRGEPSLGQLCRNEFGEAVRLVGFGVARGSVTAAQGWGSAAERMTLNPGHDESYEGLCRQAELPAFVLSLRDPSHPEIRDALSAPRLQRAIGPVYRPQTERASHYFQASLPDQFDEYIWFDEGHALTPVA